MFPGGLKRQPFSIEVVPPFINMASSNGSPKPDGSNAEEVKQTHTSKAVPAEVRRELWKVSWLEYFV